MQKIQTEILLLDNAQNEKKAVERAAAVLKQGGLVAFPTETVYGLGALGLEDSSAAKIFAAKKRALSNPLTLMLGDLETFFQLSPDLPSEAECLARNFWPGPLTLIVRAGPLIPEIITAGTGKVGFRIPNHPVALALLRCAGVPLAVPSANLSGRPSPTAASHVLSDLNGRIDLILDGGRSDLGLESTVLDLTGEEIKLLRPGSITQEEIEGLLKQKIAAGKTAQSKHYQPNARVIVVSGKDREKVRQKINELLKAEGEKRIAVLTRQPVLYPAEISRCMGEDVTETAAHLFDYLREMDEKRIELIIVEGMEKTGLGAAVMNRLEKAAAGCCFTV